MFQDGVEQDLPSSSPAQERKGRLLLFSYQAVEPPSRTSEATDSLKLNQQHDLSAILDAKWNHSHGDESPNFALVDAGGGLSLWNLDQDEGSVYQCQEISRLTVSEDALALSLDWSARLQHRSESCCATKNLYCLLSHYFSYKIINVKSYEKFLRVSYVLGN